jgi:iron complex transport system substrate-binding protein
MNVRLAVGVLTVAAPALLAGCAPSSSSSTATGAGSSPRPSRIISLAPTATEDLYAVGAGRQVVAVDADSDYPAQAPVTKLSGLSPNVEAIAKYRPDLVIASQDTGGLSAGLKKLGIPVLIEPAAASLDDAYAQIGQIGQATGHQAQARRTVASMKAQIAADVKRS